MNLKTEKKNKYLYSRGSIRQHLGLSAKVKSLVATIHARQL